MSKRNNSINIMAYKILDGKSAEALNIQIANHIAKGWIPRREHRVTMGFNYMWYSQARYHPGISQ